MIGPIFFFTYCFPEERPLVYTACFLWIESRAGLGLLVIPAAPQGGLPKTILGVFLDTESTQQGCDG